MTYTPRIPMTLNNIEDVRLYLEEELRNISLEMPQFDIIQFRTLHVEPAKRTDGMLAYADGVNWSPSGGGEGIYAHINGSWEGLAGGGGGASVAWVDITGKPATFPPTVPIPWVDISGKPATFPPSSHSHPQSEVTGLVTDLALKAPLASPIFTGNPTAPTPTVGDNDTSIATTAFVQAAVTASGGYGDENAQDAIGTILLDSATIDFTYTDATPSITAIVKTGSINLAAGGHVTGNLPTGNLNNGVAASAATWWCGNGTWDTPSKITVGLGNVDNTSDMNKPVSTAQAAADALRVLKAGDTMTGNLTIARATPVLFFNDTSSVGSFIGIQQGAVPRYEVQFTPAVFSLLRYNDAGASLGSILSISRATGLTTLTGDATLTKVNPGLALNKTASTQYAIVGGQMSGNYRWLVVLGTTAPESGGNTGSDFGITRCADDGVGIDTPFSINRATGDIAVNTATASTSTTTGALTVAGGVGVAGNLFVGAGLSATGDILSSGTTKGVRIQATGVGNTDWSFNGAVGVTVANGANAQLAPTHGIVIVRDNTVSGVVALLLLTNSTVTIVSQGGSADYVVSTTPAAGKTGVNWGGSNYRIYNNTGSSVNYSITSIKG